MEIQQHFKKYLALLLYRRALLRKKQKLLIAKFLLNQRVITMLLNSYCSSWMHQVLCTPPLTNGRQLWKHERNSTFWECDVTKMDEQRFKENFRMSRCSFQKILQKLECIQKQDTNMRPAIPLDKRVAIALFVLGSSGEYRTVANLFGVGRSTVGEIVVDFCNAICFHLKNHLNAYPPTQEYVTEVVKGFARMGFPQCFGAVDGCHIEIQPRKEQALDYYNYKGWYSVVLLAACDYRSKFTYNNIGSPGRNNDSYIFERSALSNY